MEYLSDKIHSNLNSGIIKRLNESQIYSTLDFLNCESKQIEKITPLTLKEIVDIRKQLLKKYSQPINAYNCYLNILNDFAIIPTGIAGLDSLLEGGLFTGNIYEICGLPASGKTLFCLTLLKNLAHKLNGEIIYLDTKYDFSAIKLKSMLSHLTKEELIATMNKIFITRINSQKDFLKVLLELKLSLQKGKIIKLLIIDSLSPLSFMSSDQTENNAFLNYSANILQYLAKECNLKIIVTNLMTVWNDGDFKNVDVMKERFSCGVYWYNIPNVRIVLKKNNNLCKITLLKSFRFIPDVNFCDVMFTDNGLI